MIDVVFEDIELVFRFPAAMTPDPERFNSDFFVTSFVLTIDRLELVRDMFF